MQALEHVRRRLKEGPVITGPCPQTDRCGVSLESPKMGSDTLRGGWQTVFAGVERADVLVGLSRAAKWGRGQEQSSR